MIRARSLPSLLDKLADDALGSDPYVALWDDKGLRAVVALTSGMALYSREPYAEGYDRVAVACLDGPGRVWAVKPPNHPYWVLPGGHLHEGESPTTAAMREMREETGVSVTISADLGVLHRPWARTRVYLGRRVGEPRKPTTPDEVVGVAVVDVADLDPSERMWLEPKLARSIEAWDPAEHPREPAGSEKGGEFSEHGGYDDALGSAFRAVKKSFSKGGLGGKCWEVSHKLVELLRRQNIPAKLRGYDMGMAGPHWTVVLPDGAEYDPTISSWKRQAPPGSEDGQLYQVSDDSPHKGWSHTETVDPLYHAPFYKTPKDWIWRDDR